MVIKVDDAGVFGNDTYEKRLMPIVFVNKITLENNSAFIEVENPHIQEYAVKLDKNGEVAYLKSQPPTTSPNALLITVDLIVKDVIESSELSSWFYDAELLKYMKIKVIQSVDKSLTDKLINGEVGVLTDANRGLYKEKIISLSKEGEDTKSFYSTDETGRSLAADIPYKTTFSLSDSQPNHLAYFVFCYFDIAQMSQDFNLNMYGYNMSQGVISEHITSEIVIDNGSVVSESYIFYTPEGEIWNGAVHQQGGVYMAGATHGSHSHSILTLEKAVNTTVQDFRDIDAPLAKEINLKPTESLLDRIGENYAASKVTIEDRSAYFSDAFVTRGLEADGTISNFVFSFDFMELIKQQSQFGSLFTFSRNTEAKKRMLKLSRVITLKIFRHRANPQITFNKVGSPVKGGNLRLYPYSASGKAPVLVVESGDINGSLKKKKKKTEGSIREIYLRNTGDIRTYAVSDYTIDKETDGLYQYSVEVEVEDGTITYMNDILSKLSKSLGGFSLYYNLSTSPSFYDESTGQFKPEFMDYYDSKRSPIKPWVDAIAQFCQALSILTDMRTAENTRLYKRLFALCNPSSGTPSGIYGILGLIQKLEAILVDRLGDKKSVNVNRIAKTGTSQSFEKFILKDTQLFSHLFDSEVPDKYGLEFVNLRNRNSYSGPHTFTVQDYMKRLVQENSKYFVPKGAKLSPTNPSQTSTSQVPGSDPFSGLRDLETYGATYLTPETARNGSLTLSMSGKSGDMLANAEGFSDFSVSMLTREMQKHGNNVEPAPASTENNNERANFLGQLGVTVKSPFESGEVAAIVSSVGMLGSGDRFSSADESSQFPPPVPEVDLKQVANMFSSNLNFMRNQRFSPDASFKGTNKVEQIKIGNLNLANNGAILDNYSTPDSTDAYDTEAMRAIPNQIKSVIMSADDIVKENWFAKDYDVANDTRTAAMFMWNYQNIAQVEYLVSYKRTSTEGMQVSAPVWVPLKFNILNTLIRESSVVLCRLVMYSDSVYKIGMSQFAQMPYYNSYFLLASDNKAAAASKPTARSSRSLASTLSGLGSKLSNELSKSGSSTNMRTVIRQEKARNPQSYHDPYKDNGNLDNIVSTLMDEVSGLCIGEILIPETRPRIASPTQEVADSNEEEDDTFAYNLDFIGAPLETGGKESIQTFDYVDSYIQAVAGAVSAVPTSTVASLVLTSDTSSDYVDSYIQAVAGAVSAVPTSTVASLVSTTTTEEPLTTIDTTIGVGVISDLSSQWSSDLAQPSMLEGTTGKADSAMGWTDGDSSDGEDTTATMLLDTTVGGTSSDSSDGEGADVTGNFGGFSPARDY